MVFGQQHKLARQHTCEPAGSRRRNHHRTRVKYGQPGDGAKRVELRHTSCGGQLGQPEVGSEDLGEVRTSGRNRRERSGRARRVQAENTTRQALRCDPGKSFASMLLHPSAYQRIDGCIHAIYGRYGGDRAHPLMGDARGSTAYTHHRVDCACQYVVPLSYHDQLLTESSDWRSRAVLAGWHGRPHHEAVTAERPAQRDPEARIGEVDCPAQFAAPATSECLGERSEPCSR